MWRHQGKRRARVRRDRVTSVLASAGVLTLAAGLLVLGTAAPASAHAARFDASCGGIRIVAEKYGGQDNIWSVTINGVTNDGTFDESFARTFPVPQGGALTVWSAFTQEPDGDHLHQDGGTVGPCDQPRKPQPVVVDSTEQRSSCAGGVEERTVTSTTNWVWDEDESAWVKDTASTSATDWTTVRDLTAEERAELQCDRPDQPPAFAISGTEQRLSCDAGLEERTFTTTTEFVFDEETAEWVKGEPVTTFSDWATIRPLNDEEAAELDCLIPPTEAVDVCHNIPGAQESVPDGLETDGRDCVQPDEVNGTEAPRPGQSDEPKPTPQPKSKPKPLPTAVAAGLVGPLGPTAGPGGPANRIGLGLVGGGAILLLAAGGRLTRRQVRVGARQA